MNLEVIKKFDDLIILMRWDEVEENYEYYISNPWYTAIHHWIGVQNKMSNKVINWCYEDGEFKDFISRYCF